MAHWAMQVPHMSTNDVLASWRFSRRRLNGEESIHDHEVEHPLCADAPRGSPRQTVACDDGLWPRLCENSSF